jgi:hypothetical protein
VGELQQYAEQEYRPVVDAILGTGSRDAAHLERTLDGLLDFCGHEPVVAMFKQLCRHYGTFDPAARLTTSLPTANDGARRRERAGAVTDDEERRCELALMPHAGSSS